MPKVIVGESARISSEADKKMRAFEKNIKAELFFAQKERKISHSDIADVLNLSRQTVDGIFNAPLSAKPKNLFMVLAYMGVQI